eukprot:TRINITY_DN1458_c0_g1_i2.p2 TRINITY_DN1458_c0_g1~~TRINITY_DN1458_c0_g1_i2.p2  ORF type:complete len:125 (-),score=26.85 TRINITY_DN1458_c0_g1_i2:102-476(-)
MNIPTDITIVPTLREKDGLAMSSRNMYLNPEERSLSPIIANALFEAEKLFKRGERDRTKLIDCAMEVLKNPRVTVDYVSLASLMDGSEILRVNEDGEGALLSAAIKIGSTRLIDNVILYNDKKS